jgi:AraC family transcriptional regulator of adaptative response/methylated-DNA-[protein]-cysteine methyltransferase
LLVAGTERGVCFVGFGDGAAQLRQRLAEAFPFAALEAAEAGAPAAWAQVLADYVDGRCDVAEVPLDVSGSRFEQRVWQELRRTRWGRPGRIRRVPGGSAICGRGRS